MATFQLSKKQIVIFLAVVVFLLTLLYGQRFADSNDQDDKEFALAVPFTTQAPTGDWEGNENCEEASAIMANAYLTGNTSSNLDPREVNKTINNLIDWENANLGHHADTGIDDTAKMVESAFQLKTKKIYNFTEEDLKRELKDNHVLLLPINAQGLNHPNYQRGNVIYHMVVIHGYNEKGFIIHDPGTEEGKDNVYAFDKLFNPAADWDNIVNELVPERKVVLVVGK
jgi:hypothetical protein